MTKKFTVEIDADELNLLLNAVSTERWRLGGRMKRAKGNERAEIESRIDAMKARYLELDRLLDPYVNENGDPI